MYPVVQVSRDLLDFPEQLGTKPKWWFRKPSGVEALFKEGRCGTGENWAEKISSELAALLSLPHAHYDLAECEGRQGVVCETVVPDQGRLVHGNEVLGRLIPGYDGTPKYKQRGHTVRIVTAILKGVAPPPASPQEITTGRDAFVGYLLFDAWIGNQDRHAQNWALVRTPDSLFLAPTFDHASSLGRNESDQVREERMTTRDVRRSVPCYVAKARSALYSSPNDAKPLSTLAAFTEAAKLSQTTAEFWMEKLNSVELATVEERFRNFPDGWISDSAVRFSIAMLRENKRRILASMGG